MHVLMLLKINEVMHMVCPSKARDHILLVFPDRAGKPAEHPISEFITRSSAEAEAGRDAAADKKVDRKFPTHTFLFAGSRLVDDGPGPRTYLSDDSGNVISIVKS